MNYMRVSPDGQHVALFRHPPNVDDRADLVIVDRFGTVANYMISGWESLEESVGAIGQRDVLAAESGEQLFAAR